ncbi:MAG: J domain-containing protein [Thermoplasmatota archaeon]
MSSITKGRTVLAVFFLSILFFTSLSARADSAPTRAPVLYSGSVDGVGSSGDICLAGHRDYNISFDFFDTDPSEMDSIGVNLRSGATSSRLFRWDLITPDIAQEMLTDQLEIGGLGYSFDGVNTTFFFEAFFHLNWDYERQLTIVPVLEINSTDQDLDALSELQIMVHGTLEPYGIVVEKDEEENIEEGDQVRSNSTITVKNMKFRYWHLTEYLSPFSPRTSEITVVLNDGTATWNATATPDGFMAEIKMADVDDARVDIRMDIPVLSEDWKAKVSQWKFSIGIDGLSPDITLRYPVTKVEEEEFEWEITITERPKNKLEVDGSSVKYRVGTLGIWGQWQTLPMVGDDRVIVLRGNAQGAAGKGNTSLQFRASDVLGNENVSRVFVIDINQGPDARVPVTVNGMEFFKNESLIVVGTEWVSDPDDPLTKLRFEWYLDDDIQPHSTSVMFNKTLFTLNEGEHTVRMKVTDGDESDEVSFSFFVKNVPQVEDDDEWYLIFTDATFLTISVPILVAFLIIIVVIVIIVISKKLRRTDDFIINEENTMSTSQAEEMAKKIRALYEDVAAQYSASENDAQIDYDDGKFDFDYNLYEVLDLESSASETDIKKKYRKLAAFYHPDRVATHREIDPLDAAEHMVKINKAKEILLNPELKPEYDTFITEMDFSMDLNDDDGEDVENSDDEDDEVWG